MPSHSLSANRLSERIRAAIRRSVRAAGATRLVVACSGGADSVCLAHATAHVARERGWLLLIAHVRHGLRAGDATDADHVAALAEALDVPFAVRELAFGEDGPPTSNIEATLRAARYAALAEMAAAHDAQAILTGHTLDDQAETVLLRLFRGSGGDGLAGIAERGEIDIAHTSTPIALLRPLLFIGRDETHAYCAAHDLVFVHDPTNDDDRFTRNWLRHRVLPLLQERYPAAPAALARTAALVADEADYLHRQSRAAFATCVRSVAPHALALDHAAFAALHPAVQRRVVRETVAQLGCAPLRMEQIERLREAALAPSRAVVRVDGLACRRVDDAVVIAWEDALCRVVGYDTAAPAPSAASGAATDPLGVTTMNERRADEHE